MAQRQRNCFGVFVINWASCLVLGSPYGVETGEGSRVEVPGGVICLCEMFML